jgi:hypothetical protein
VDQLVTKATAGRLGDALGRFCPELYYKFCSKRMVIACSDLILEECRSRRIKTSRILKFLYLG